MLAGALTKAHLSGAAVYVPQIVDGKIMQSQSLTPLRTDPRLRDPSDTVSNGAGGAAPRRMTIDGEFMVPKTLPLNRLTVGKHTQTVSLQDVAGQTSKYTNTFVVTTSFADLATVIDQYADNALRSTLNGAQAIGATGLRLANPIGYRAGQQLVLNTGDSAETVTIAKVLSPPPTLSTTLSSPAGAGATEVRIASYTQSSASPPTNNGPIVGQPIVLDTGANQEVVTVKRHITPLPAAPAPNVVLSAPLAKDHAAGTATNLNNVILSAPTTKAHANGAAAANPRPYISAAKANELRTLLADAKTKADGGQTAAAIAALELFKTAAAGEPALVSAGQGLIAQLQGTPVDTAGTGVTIGAAEAGVQVLRTFYNPMVPGLDSGRDVQGARQRPRGWLPAPVDRRLRVDDPGPRVQERLRRRRLGPEHQRQPGPPGPGRRLADGQPVHGSGHAQAVQDDRLQLDGRPQRARRR